MATLDAISASELKDAYNEGVSDQAKKMLKTIKEFIPQVGDAVNLVNYNGELAIVTRDGVVILNDLIVNLK
jgi:hypothetical protein